MQHDSIGTRESLGKLGEINVSIKPVAIVQKRAYALDDIATLTFHSADTKMSSRIDEAVYGV